MTKTNKKGTSLVELLAVIVIMGIIAAIAVPTVGALLKNTRMKAAKSDMDVLYSAAQTYFAAEDATSVTAAALLDGNYASLTKTDISDNGTKITFNQAANGQVTITTDGDFTYTKNGKKYTFTALNGATEFAKPTNEANA